jgi:hypothetical protein
MIPLLYFKADEQSKYHKYYNILHSFIERIQLKIRKTIRRSKLPELCPLEMTVLKHVIDVVKHGVYAAIDIMSLYEVIYTYEFCADTLGDYHFDLRCKCKRIFCMADKIDNNIQNDNIISMNQSIKHHYDIMQQIGTTYQTLLKIMKDRYKDSGKFSFNIDHKVYYEGKSTEFYIHNPSIPFIAFSDRHVIYFVIKPSFNKLNFNTVIVDAILNKFLISQCPELSNNAFRYKDKKVLVCIFTLSTDMPLVFEPIIPNDNDLITYVEDCMKDKYTKINKKVIEFYKSCASTRPSGKNSIQYTKEELQQYPKLPLYIQEYFTLADDKCKRMTPPSERSKCVNLDDLNALLYERIHQFLYGTDGHSDNDY